eukprot:1161743-Pelagomonas_calceolata.AAC.3
MCANNSGTQTHCWLPTEVAGVARLPMQQSKSFKQSKVEDREDRDGRVKVNARTNQRALWKDPTASTYPGCESLRELSTVQERNRSQSGQGRQPCINKQVFPHSFKMFHK